MRVLIGCEESGVVRRAFEALGHDAWSNDLIPARDNSKKHLQKDVKKAIVEDGPWDIIILHPDCTKLAVSGNSTYAPKGIESLVRTQAKKWTHDLFKLACSKAKMGVCLENPVGILGIMCGIKPVYIHPWQFGHLEQKKTGLWLYRLSPLKETNNVFDAMMKLPKCQREKNHYMSPGPNRKRDRSKTYSGIAEAFADQWGKVNA